MIIKDYQLEKIIDENKSFTSFLFYGPNEGLVREQINKIEKKINSKNKYEKLHLSGKDLDEDKYILDETLKTVSMFFDGKIVIVESLKDKHLPIMESIQIDAPQDTVIIVKADNLPKASKIRKFFETQNLCYSLACYEDDAKSLMKQIENFNIKNNLKLNRDEKSYLLQNLSNDRMINNNELEKINLYANHTKQEVSLEIIKLLLNDSSSENLNKLNESVMSGNTSKSSKIISKLLSEGASPVGLIRSLANYLKRIKKTKIEMKKGNDFESSIKLLKPPVFWKDKDNFQKHCLKWPLHNIESNLFKLLETEITCKLNSKLTNLNCEKSILVIASNGRRYFGN